jgi:FkbM family methyltransferase
MQETVFSMVPGQAPICLAAYYPSFKDYYFDCELQTKRWAVENVGEDWTICVIGANVGVYSCLFGRLASRGTIHAFEPTRTFDMLKANLAANKLENVHCHQLAVGSRTGRRDEKIFRIWGSVAEEGDYDFTTLDDFFEGRDLTRLDCVKIDVDGFDLEVLKGAERTLRRFNPWIVIELNHALATRGQSVSDAFLWLQSQGYGSAFAMDKENFLLRRREGERATEGITISFDRDPVLLEPLFGPGEDLGIVFHSQPRLHNGAGLAATKPETITCIAPRWSYIASWPVIENPEKTEAIIEIDALILSGVVGFGGIRSDWTTYATREVELQAGPGQQTALIPVDDLSALAGLMSRGNGPDGGETRFTISAVRVSRPAPLPARYAPVMRSNVRQFDLEKCWPAGNHEHRKPVDIVPVSELGQALGFEQIYSPPRLVYPYGIADFKTEIDEPEIYRFIYRNFRPLRHLEFGTWEGFGAALCASSCQAEIWTVDMPTGELDAQGNPIYGARVLPGETRIAEHQGIGWRYQSAGFGDRVHQIFSDSRELDVSAFTPGFFDSVLIDGGHTADVVISDTLKALPLLRTGGLMIWHDFCPDPDVLLKSEAGRGVVEGLRTSYDRWSSAFGRLFWVRPSWLLVGVKK